MTARKGGPLVAAAVAIATVVGGAAGYWFALHLPTAPSMQATQAGIDRKVLYYRDPTGAPYWSAVAKKTSDGRDYLPVFDDKEPPLVQSSKQSPAGQVGRRILYYRNPMGLPDTSPAPKKDWMGMDYIAVYEGEEQDDGSSIKISLDRLQRSGVRTEAVASRVLVRPVRAAGTVTLDESRLTVVTMRAEGFIEKLFVDRTGQMVHAGEPLFRIYSPLIQQGQTDLIVALRAAKRGANDAERSIEGPMQKLRNLGVPESRIREVMQTGENPRTLDWPSPATGDVIAKRVVNGQRVAAGDELYRIADHSHLWLIADVPESDIAQVKIDARATIILRAFVSEPIEGIVTFIYPYLKPETRTGQVRIEFPNPGGKFKPDMYADVVFKTGAETLALTVPEHSVIDSGTRQIVLIAKGEGRFEPRAVKLGRRGDLYVEILEGVTEGEEVVTSATFLIDAESNLRAALKSFEPSEAPK